MNDIRTARVGAGCALAGVLLTLAAFATVVTGVTDPFADISSAQYLGKVADASTLWRAVHLVIALAALLKVAGLLALGETLERRGRNGLVRAGNAFAVCGGVLLVVTMVFDGYVHGYMADQWNGAGAATQQSYETIFGGSLRISYGVEITSLIAFLGFAPIAYGLAMRGDSLFPRWLSRLGVYGGAGAVLTATVLWMGGPSDFGYGALYPVFAIAVPAVFILTAARRMWTLDARTAATTAGTTDATTPAAVPVPAGV